MGFFNKKKKIVPIPPQRLQQARYIKCAKDHLFDTQKYKECPYCDETIKKCECGLFFDSIFFKRCPLCKNDSKKRVNDAGFLKYVNLKRKGEQLPENIQVSLDGPTPNGGVFSLMLSGYNGNGCEIHECDENGNSIYRTYGYTRN